MSYSETNAERQPGWMLPYGLSLVTGDSLLPVSVKDLRKQCNIDHQEDDDLLKEYCQAATEELEEAVARSLLNKTYDLSLDRWPSDWIELPIAPLVSVTSISYVDGNGATQTWDSDEYLVDTKREPARISPAWGLAWPTSRLQLGAITVRFVAGYGASADDLPAKAKQAIRLWVGEAYESRELGFESSLMRGPRAAQAWQALLSSLRWRRV